jgi:hypothetical protein
LVTDHGGFRSDAGKRIRLHELPEGICARKSGAAHLAVSCYGTDKQPREASTGSATSDSMSAARLNEGIAPGVNEVHRDKSPSKAAEETLFMSNCDDIHAVYTGRRRRNAGLHVRKKI